MLKVGDKVKIRNDLSLGIKYNGIEFKNDSYIKHKGSQGKIINISRGMILQGKIVDIYKVATENGQIIGCLLDMFELSNEIDIFYQHPETDWKELYKKHINEENKRFGITDRYYNPEE